MVTLEAWALGIPVLVNGQCDVLRGQTIRANAGLYYSTYDEFYGALRILEKNSQLRRSLGANGRSYFKRNYTWPVIEKKYLNMLERLQKEDKEGVNVREQEPLPGWFARRRRNLPAASDIVNRLPTGPILPRRSNR